MSNKSLAIIGIVMCLVIAGCQLFKSINDRLPVAEVEQCVNISYDGVSATVQILENNPVKGESLVYSYTNGRTVNLSFSDMREMNAKVVECK